MPCTVSGLVKAVPWVAMAGEDDDLVASVLQADRCIDHQSLCTSNSQVGVEKDNGLFVALLLCHLANEMECQMFLGAGGMVAKVFSQMTT